MTPYSSLILCALLAACGGSSTTPTRGVTPAQAQSADAPRPVFVGIGDSTMQRGEPHLVALHGNTAQMLATETGHDWCNCGIGGATSEMVYDNLEICRISCGLPSWRDADTVVIMLGRNDLRIGESPGYSAHWLRDIVLQHVGASHEVFVATTWAARDEPHGSEGNDWVAHRNSLLHLEVPAVVWDAAGCLTDYGYGPVPAEYRSDRVHLNLAGNERLAECWKDRYGVVIEGMAR